jgi:hypothetical protein
MVSRRPWPRQLLGPLVLIALGVLLLLTNLGYLPRDTWRTLWQFWPVLLILLGAELLLTGRASWGAIVVALLILLVFGAAAGATGIFALGGPVGRTVFPVGGGTQVQQTLDGARAAEVKLSHGADQLTLAGGTGGGMLLEGSTSGADENSVAKRYRVNDGVGILDLSLARARGLGWLFRGDENRDTADLRLSREVPIRRLEVDGGASDVTLDLREVQLQRLDLQTGASRLHVSLPARGAVSAGINAGASSLTLEIPPEVAADIRVEGGLSSVTIDEQRFSPVRIQGVPGLGFQREYRSPGYDGAQNRADVRISAGAASIEVR